MVISDLAAAVAARVPRRICAWRGAAAARCPSPDGLAPHRRRPAPLPQRQFHQLVGIEHLAGVEGGHPALPLHQRISSATLVSGSRVRASRAGPRARLGVTAGGHLQPGQRERSSWLALASESETEPGLVDHCRPPGDGYRRHFVATRGRPPVGPARQRRTPSTPRFSAPRAAGQAPTTG